MTTQSTVDLQEVETFSAHASGWWDQEGPFKPLHQLTPLRMGFLKETIGIPQGRRILDIGCGGGLVCEPLARLGAHVTGIDPSPKNITAAELHRGNLPITYKACSVEEMEGCFDVVLALEVVEHVASLDAFLFHCSRLLSPGGLLILSTLNRTPMSFFGGIVAAEYMLNWVPRGTHDWTKFVKPSELTRSAAKSSLILSGLQGFGFDLVQGRWKLQESVKINYFAVLKKLAEREGFEPSIRD